MKFKLKQAPVLAAAVLIASTTGTFAEGINKNNFYGGIGLNFNTIGFGNATGVQVLGGYDFDFKINNDISSALEIGYMDSGNFDNNGAFNGFGNNNDNSAQGLWVTMVESVPVSNKVKTLARVGVDLGDDDGLMVGAGMEYSFNSKSSFRTEYVARDNINSFQFNVLFNF